MTEAKTAINLRGVTKNYGTKRGITDVSLSVKAGEIFGFLGPNGAGKTTTISLMIDLIRPSKGKISIFGFDSIDDSLEIRRRVGFLAGDIALDKGLTGWQQLEYFGNIRGSFNKKYVKELASRLDCNLNRKFKTLSRGNKQKVGLIAALMHDPDLLILDEPTSGLDPLVQSSFNKIVLERQKLGKTAFISSHMLSEVQEICDKAAFIREGKIIAIKSLSEIAKKSPKQIQLFSHDKALALAVKKLSGVKNYSYSGSSITCTYMGNVNLLLNIINKHHLDNVTIQDADLETVFMKYYEGRND